MMKENDLMVGDWVRLEYKNPNTGDLIRKDFQVDQIVRPWRDEPHDAWSKENGNMGQVAYMTPIPLTAEILEKNGFGNTAAKNEKFLYIGKKQVWVDLKKDKHWVNIKYDDDNLNLSPFHYYEGYISYVHELQHALRLCGIDKTIEL